MKSLYCFLTSVLLLINCYAATDSDTKMLMEQIQGINNKIAQLIVNHAPVEEIYANYANDAISMMPYMEMVKGKDKIMRVAREDRLEGTIIRSFNTKTLQVQKSGNMIYEIGTYAVSATTKERPKPIAEIGKYLVIWEVKADGSLQVKVEIWNTDVVP